MRIISIQPCKSILPAIGRKTRVKKFNFEKERIALTGLDKFGRDVEFNQVEKALAICLDMTRVEINSDILFDVILKTAKEMPQENVNTLYPLVGKGIL